MSSYDELYELMQSGNPDTSLINELYNDVLEMGDIYLAAVNSCGAPTTCGKSPNVCDSKCNCKC